MRKSAKEIEGLRVALAGVEKARDAEKAEKQTIEHKVFNNVCEAHDSSGFQHFL